MDSGDLPKGNLERITKRDEERKHNIEKRKEDKEVSTKVEKSIRFEESFYSTCREIKELLDNAETTPVTSLPGIFNNVYKEIAVLKNYIFQSKQFLKNYDLRKAQEHLQFLESEADRLDDKLIPKKKFGFKNRKLLKNPLDITSDTTDSLKKLNIADSLENEKEKQNTNNIYKKYLDNSCTLKNRFDEYLVLDAENVNKNDVILTDLKRCTVCIYGAPITVHILNLEECTVLIGPVTSSVFIEKCNNCQFATACQQFRLHSSTNCTIYLHVTSRGIIEDCIKICFAPYNWTYPDQSNHFILAGLDSKTNHWNSIDDFNWLFADEKSPNWTILEPELRIQDWNGTITR